MQLRDKKTVVVCLISIMLCLVIVPKDTQFAASVQDGAIGIIDENTLYQPEAIMEGERVFHTSAAGDDYADSFHSMVLGTNVTGPPSGMGEDSTSATELTESYYTEISWTNLMTQTSFTGLPSGWEDNNMYYSGDYFHSNFGYVGTGYIACSGVSTTGHDTVRFTVLGLTGIFDGGVYIDFYDSSSNWDQIGSIPRDYDQDSVFSSTDSQYKHSNFRVRYRFVQNGFMEMCTGTNWRIDVEDDTEARGLDITYKFTDVDFDNFTSEQLYVEFDSNSSSEYLDFRFESGDTTPDFLIGDDQNSTFNVDIHSYLDGSECYVNIRDEYRIGDDNTDYWRISRMYIRLTNAVPENDQVPACTNLDDADNLYARHRLYEFNSSVVDADGYSNIDYVELRSYDASMTELRWVVRFDEDTDTFTEEAGISYINLTGSEFFKSSNYINITFKLYVEWEHPDSTDDCIVQYVRDSSGDFDEDTYLVNYDYVTRLDIHGLTLDDGTGASNWGNINGNMTASGTLTYFGSIIIPASDQLDVWGSAPLDSGGGPWYDYTLDLGYFTMTVDADDTVGIDIYSFIVVLNGAGPEGASLLHFSENCVYVSDCVQVEGYSAEVTDLILNEVSECNVTLCYEIDGSPVTDGIVTVNGIDAKYTGSDGIWSFNETYSTVQVVTYDSVVVSGDSIGVTEVNQNSQSITLSWDSATTTSTTPVTTDVESTLFIAATIGVIAIGVIALVIILGIRKE